MLQFPALPYEKPIKHLLKKLIAIPSMKGEGMLNMPYGKDAFRALMLMLDEAEQMDLNSVNLFGHMGYAEYGSGKETVAILTHLDVVPPGDGWETPPFEAVEKDGRIYGRGAVDDKGAAVAALFALYLLKENCVNVHKKIQVVFGCDEESGWGDIAFFKSHYPAPDYVITPDAHFPIINREKGLLQIRLHAKAKKEKEGTAILHLAAGTRVNIVPAKAECELNAPLDLMEKLVQNYAQGLPVSFSVFPGKEGVRICCQGKAAHGSQPEEGENALWHLILFLNSLPLAAGKGEAFVYALASLFYSGYDGKGMGIAGSREGSGAVTANLATIAFEKGEIEAKVDIRFPVGMQGKELLKTIREACKKQGILVDVLHAQEPHFVPEDSKLVQTLKRVYEASFGKPGECQMCAGATYARAFPNSVAFGPVPQERPSMEHRPNEYIEIEDLLKLTEVLATAMIELAGGTDGLL